MFQAIIILLLGLICIFVSADYFVSGSSLLARRFGIPKLIIGLTIVAIGTSAPELAVNVFAAIRNETDLVLGNVLGSNIANVLLIFAVANLFVKKVSISKDSLTQISVSVIAALAVSALAWFGLSGGIAKLEGLALIFAGLVYWMYLYRITVQDKERLVIEDIAEQKLDRFSSNLVVALITLFCLVVLLFGSHLVTGQAVIIAHALGISELVIAATVIAIGTSLPELVTSIQAVRRRQYDLMIGNVVGSNVVNSLFVLGLSSVINKIHIAGPSQPYLTMHIFAPLLLLLGFTIAKPRTFSRMYSFLFLIIYVGFIIYIII